MPRKIRAVTIKAALLLFSVLLALVLAEGFLHVLVPPSKGNLFMFTTKSKCYKVMRPNNLTIVYGVPFQTNELGFRDDTEKVPPKAPGEERIIVLGDSITAAAGVPFASTYPQAAQRELARHTGNPRIKVVNLAGGGYNLLQFRYTLTETGLSLSPDYVVAGISVSQDFDRMNFYEEARRVAMGGVAETPGWTDRLYLTLAFGMYLRHFYTVVSSKLNSSASQQPVAVSGGGDERDINNQALLDIQSALSERHIPLLVILLPECFNFARQQAAHSQAAQFCRANHIDVVDMLPRLASDGRGPWYYRLNFIDNHPNGRYDELVGDELAKALAQRLGPTKNGTAATAQY